MCALLIFSFIIFYFILKYNKNINIHTIQYKYNCETNTIQYKKNKYIMKLFIHSEYIYFDILQISKTTSKCSKYKIKIQYI